jgi:hypothetical protein
VTSSPTRTGVVGDHDGAGDTPVTVVHVDDDVIADVAYTTFPQANTARLVTVLIANAGDAYATEIRNEVASVKLVPLSLYQNSQRAFAPSWRATHILPVES